MYFVCVYVQSCLILCNPMTIAHGIFCPWNFPGKNTRVGCHFLLQGIFSTQKSNPHLLHLLLWQVNSLSLCHLGRHTCVCVCVYIYIYHYFFKSKGTVYQCIGMINRLIDRKMNPLLIVPVKQEYKINEEKIKTI